MNGAVAWLPGPPARFPNLAKRPWWMVQCKPHVMTRLKRVFERVNKHQHGTVLLADSPETSRELLWFLDRFPMAIEAGDRKRLEDQAKVHKDREALTQLILAGDYTPTGETSMALPPREYQVIAADLVCATGGLLLADDLGLGKTVSAIAALAKKGLFPALVVTLTHLPRQWQAELEKFTPGLKTHVLEKAAPYDLVRDKWRKRKPCPKNEAIGCMPDVIIANYQKLNGWAETLVSLGVRAVVFDECQELRSGEDTAKYSAARHICREAVLKLGLSGTPIYNYGGEIFNVINILNEDALGTREEFNREWCNAWESKPRLKDPKAFGLYVRDAGLMLRRTRAEVGRELPALTTIPHEVEASKRLANFGRDLADLARIIIADHETEKGAKFRASGELDYKLRRETGMAKADFIADFVRMLVESGESVVLYGWHHDVYQVWRHALKDLNPAFYTGKESATEKERQINRFKAGETKVAILSLRAGAGLDGLQRVCRTVVFGELDWSPGVHEQAIGRVYRDGQAEPVCAYFLIANSGSDPIIADTLGVKRGQIEGLRNPNAEVVEQGVDPNHMRKLAESFLRQRGELPPALEAEPEQLPPAKPAGFAPVAETEQNPPDPVATLVPESNTTPAAPRPKAEPTQLGLFEEETHAA